MERRCLALEYQIGDFAITEDRRKTRKQRRDGYTFSTRYAVRDDSSLPCTCIGQIDVALGSIRQKKHRGFRNPEPEAELR